jgi:hypothetical protein
MDYKFFFLRLKDILVHPGNTWEVVATENRPTKFLRNNFFFPLLALVTISSFIGSILFSNSTLSPLYSVFVAAKVFIVWFIVVFSSATLTGEITSPLDLGRSFAVSYRLIVYSLTPLMICQMSSLLFESLIFVNVLSLYGLYIFWTGAEKMLNPPQHKKGFLMISVFIVVAEIFIALSLAFSSIIDRIYFSFFA